VPVVQQNSGLFNGTSAVVTLPSATSSANLLVISIGADVTMQTLAGWTLRTSQVNDMGHYMWTKQGDGASSWTFTADGALPGAWYIEEITDGTYINATGQNNVTSQTTYGTTTLTPTAGQRRMLASIGSLHNSSVRTLSGWTNSYVEQSDQCSNVPARPLQGTAALEATADGVTGYSTTATYSLTNTSKSALHGAFGTSSGGAPAIPPILVMAPLSR
jgi:hypothetical protein